MNDDEGPAGGASSLTGPAYVRHSRTAATEDDEVSGRWIAVDESGWDGEQLYGRSDRHLVLGSIAIDDISAAPIVERLRRDAGLTQPPELKFGQFTGTRRDRLAVLVDLLKPGGVLADKASVFMVDKHYFVAGKIIDLLLEEHAFNLGHNLHAGRFARELARTLFNEGPRALGQDCFNRLIATVVNFASMRNRDGSQVNVDGLFDEIDRAWAQSHRRRVTAILFDLRTTRLEAASYLHALRDSDPIPTMEPLIPCLNGVVGDWSAKLGRVSALVDEQKVFTDERLDQILAVSSWRPGPSGRYIRMGGDQAARAIVRGVSREHPSIQLADLVAGAGREVARRHAGIPSPAGEQLRNAIVPLINEHSMVPHDEPGRFANAGTA
ncbi:hypothetical protein [Amycolatopsis sp. cmx-11-12]|uniref:hypothetical protein n=1 Tax=Amycolatopsis sp. cmx-11-12 TaxID=2785795 RepID=UPI003917C5CE